MGRIVRVRLEATRRQVATMTAYVCSRCGCGFDRNPAWVKSARVFCSRACSGACRRVPVEDKRRRKADYDAQRRVDLADRIRASKAEYYRRTYDPDAAREKRKATAPRMREYAARYNADPTNKAAKQAYDRDLRASAYGEYADSYRLLIELQALIRRMEPDRYLRARARGYYDREHTQQRKRHGQ